MPNVQLNLTGGTYKHKSTPLSAQVTRNFYPQRQTDDSVKSPYILQSFLGKSLFGTQSGGPDRGMFSHQSTLYKVTGEKLYSVDSAGTHTALATLAGSGRCMFAPIGSNIVIETGEYNATSRFTWNGTTLTQITDADLEAGTGIAHLNNQIIYGGLNGRFGVSDAGDETSIDGLNFATAESQADLLVRPYTFNQIAYMMGEETIEPWWNSGQGNPPFDRVEGGILQVGIVSRHAVTNDNSYVYFLANNYQVYSLRGSAAGVLTPLLPEPMVREFKSYGTVADAIMWTINLDGQWLVYLTFPSADKTWVYAVGGEWFEVGAGLSGRDLSNSYVFAFNKHLVADYQNGNIYELSDLNYDDNGDEIIRTRDTGPIHGGMVGAPSKHIEMSS